MRVNEDGQRGRRATCASRSFCVATIAVAIALAGCTDAPVPPNEERARAEMSEVAAPPTGEASGSMTLPGADGATTRFGEAMRLEDLPDWLAVPEGVAATGEGFVVTSAEGRRTGSIRLVMRSDAEAALVAWTDALSRAGLHVQRHDSGDAEAGFVVGTGEDGRRVHVSVTSEADGVECAIQYAGP